MENFIDFFREFFFKIGPYLCLKTEMLGKKTLKKYYLLYFPVEVILYKLPGLGFGF